MLHWKLVLLNRVRIDFLKPVWNEHLSFPPVNHANKTYTIIHFNLNQSVLFIFYSGFRLGFIITMKTIIYSFLFTPDYIFASSDNICYRNAIITIVIFFLIDSNIQNLGLSHD